MVFAQQQQQRPMTFQYFKLLSFFVSPTFERSIQINYSDEKNKYDTS